MKTQGKRFSHKLADFLDIPLETMIDWPQVILSGNIKAVIHNHRGVIEYDQNTVRINTKLGELKLSGQKLILVAAHQEEIVVEGKITGVDLVDWR